MGVESCCGVDITGFEESETSSSVSVVGCICFPDCVSCCVPVTALAVSLTSFGGSSEGSWEAAEDS